MRLLRHVAVRMGRRRAALEYGRGRCCRRAAIAAGRAAAAAAGATIPVHTPTHKNKTRPAQTRSCKGPATDRPTGRAAGRPEGHPGCAFKPL
eukprot:363725-Chlamydomonas_euryale.AAC.13